MNNSEYTLDHLRVIEWVLVRLKEKDYRDGFNESVGTHIEEALKREFPESDIHKVWWSDYCDRHFNEAKLRPLLGDGLYEFLISVIKESKGEGAFQMPTNMRLD